jgi:hypothetical protein
MLKKLWFFALFPGFLLAPLPAQTTNGEMTGAVTDPAGAVVPGAQVDVRNQETNEHRTTLTDNTGLYRVPQLRPGVYDISVMRQGFATENRPNIRLEVSQSVTLDFTMKVSSSSETITITGAPPLLNTTSSTLSDVIDHQATVDLPLNGRQFTQLALLTPGATPRQDAQQSTLIVPLGGLSPSTDGQQGYQNNYTMDGTLNNSLYTNSWAISPPPDAIQEFAIQAHMTDAQFSISPGANINLVTRAGTNAFHGSLWEFIRNDDLDAQTFPETARLPYRQNQYGLYVGGPIIVPHVINGTNNTWFSFYWEGYRFDQSTTATTGTLTSLMRSGNFAAELGTSAVATDCLGRPEYKFEIYDPTTSRADPCHAGEYLRNPFMYNGELNVMPPTSINSVIPTILSAYYPLPNMNVSEGTFPNYMYTSRTSVNSDIFGLRFDHQFTPNDSIFLRFNRNNAHDLAPVSINTDILQLSNYTQQAALGYTHIFNPRMILNFRYGYTYTNSYHAEIPAGAAFDNSINFAEALPPHDGISLGPGITIANGPVGITQQANPIGPIEGMDYHLDATKIVGSHTLGAGIMYYHLRSYDDGWYANTGFTQNGTAQDGTPGPTGYGAASFVLGVLDSYAPVEGDTASDQTVNWYGYYFQDQWQVAKRLALTAGFRWDYVSPANFHKIVSALDVKTGQFAVTGPVPGYYTQATAPNGLYEPQYDGYEPRFGVTYRIFKDTVIHSAFAVLDDHNNTLVQKNQAIRDSWPNAILDNLLSLDLGAPTTYINNLPSGVSLLKTPTLFVGSGVIVHDRIPYTMEYNFGVQHQLPKSMTLEVNYVGSIGRFGYSDVWGNTAPTPGPGTVLSREPYPQYGGPVNSYINITSTSYNALQTSIRRTFSSRLYFLASYTWSKALGESSDPYLQPPEDFYDIQRDWGPTTFSFKHKLLLSGIYALPFGQGRALVSHPNGFVQAIVGNWNAGEIFSAYSGQPFSAYAGSDVANVGDGAGAERAERIPGVSPYTPMNLRTPANWLNTAAFEVPAAYTWGNESRDDIFGPAFWDMDCNLSKNFPIHESTTLQFRAEAFNVYNVTDYGIPNQSANSTAFGKITSAANNGRELQFALKLLF